jgi:zinc transport system substrate-binding protein
LGRCRKNRLFSLGFDNHFQSDQEKRGPTMTAKNRHKRIYLPILFFLAGLFLASLEIGQTASANETSPRHTVFVSVPPQAELVRQIAGDRVEVQWLIPPQRDPHTFEPTPREINNLARANLYLAVGMPFENILLKKIKSINEKIIIVNCHKDIQNRSASPDHHDHKTHDHNHNAHADHDLDPHIWMSPSATAKMARSIADGLIRLDPEAADYYHARLAKLEQKIELLDQLLKERLKPYNGRAVYIYHPAIGHFCKEYGLKQKAIETDGKQPTPRQLRHLINEARKDRAGVIFVMPQFDKRAAEKIAQAIGGQTEQLDPLAPNLFENWTQITNSLIDAWKTKKRK